MGVLSPISSAGKSAGIQVVDMILWLFKRVLEDKPLGPYSADLMRYVFRRGYQNDLSFESVGGWLEGFFADPYAKPFGPEEIAKAQEYQRFAEERRQHQIAEYAENKVKTASNRVAGGVYPPDRVTGRPTVMVFIIR